MSFRTHLLIFYAFILGYCLAEPVQYCRRGLPPASPSTAPDSVDFCIGVTSYRNTTTEQQDLYITITHTRYHDWPNGWVAVGPGAMMVDSLMFIIYGDPSSGEHPVVSIRTASGHHQPTLVQESDKGKADLHVLRTQWLPNSNLNGPSDAGTPSSTAHISLVCYACSEWPSVVSASDSKSAPFLWAWNPSQVFPNYTFDSHLKMHKHHAGAGGWGNFYLDLPRALNVAPGGHLPSLPPIRSHVLSVGATETPPDLRSWLTSRSAHIHGLCMGAVFLVLFPLGVVMMRSGNQRAFQWHWQVQMVGMTVLLVGIVSGVLMKKKISSVHQGIGIAVACCAVIQVVLGWRHHVVFLRLQRRTWLSHAHIWAGRGIMFAGWSNLVTGMLLRRWATRWISLMAGTVVAEAVVLCAVLWWLRQRQEATRREADVSPAKYEAVDDFDSGFAVGDDEEGEDEEGEKMLSE